MATEAQVQANRANAQKSTGPRTPEGKEKVAQNALKHGLLVREGVIRGEDPVEYETHRDHLLEQLMPQEPLEEVLAGRIVELSWRLKRAARDQEMVFAALYERFTGGQAQPEGPEQRAAIIGRMMLEDFSGEAVLERLQRYERRIEGSLFRVLNELRRIHDRMEKAFWDEEKTLARWRKEDAAAAKRRMLEGQRPPACRVYATTTTPGAKPVDSGDSPSPAYPVPAAAVPARGQMGETDPNCRERAAGQEPASIPGTETNLPPAGGEMCETNPMWPEPVEGHGPASGPAARSNVPSAGGELCGTNPMWSGPGETQSLSPAHVAGMSLLLPSVSLCETNPIGAAADPENLVREGDESCQTSPNRVGDPAPTLAEGPII